VDSVLTWAAGATVRLDNAIVEGHAFLTDTRSLLGENRQPVRTLIANLESLSQTLNTTTVTKFHALLDSGQTGLNDAIEVMEDLRVDYAGWSTNIGEALANANLAAQQLKLTTIETRRSPWKLLYRPSSDELEHELLYEAARSFAVAAADVKAAAASAQRILESHGGQIAENQDAYRRLEQNLLKSLANYEVAQQQLLDVLVSDRTRKEP
jgi:hypothetical protein